jgi:hypothetical protein
VAQAPLACVVQQSQPGAEVVGNKGVGRLCHMLSIDSTMMEVSTDGSKRTESGWEGFFFVFAVATLCHFLYSHLGFNPTDEGYMLSGSRRLLDGQIPHRDYISLRPVGTHLLHAHVLLWGGDRLIWWSRLIPWIQFATIAWLWVRIVNHFYPVFTTSWLRFSAALIAFMACVNVFPIMPWNSVDGLFFITAGIAIHLLNPSYRWLGLIMIGCTPLFRQNFVFLVPFLLLALGEGKRWQYWILAGLPSAR